MLIGWLVIAWILSTLIEWWVASAFQREMTSGEVFMWSLQANGVSYLCLGGLVVIGSLVRS